MWRLAQESYDFLCTLIHMVHVSMFCFFFCCLHLLRAAGRVVRAHMQTPKFTHIYIHTYACFFSIQSWRVEMVFISLKNCPIDPCALSLVIRLLHLINCLPAIDRIRKPWPWVILNILASFVICHKWQRATKKNLSPSLELAKQRERERAKALLLHCRLPTKLLLCEFCAQQFKT